MHTTQMKIFLRTSGRMALTVFLLPTVLAVAGFGFRHKAAKPVAIVKPKSSEVAAATAMQTKLPSVRVEAELVTITERGFEPAKIRRPPGIFQLVVDNRSVLPEVALRLDRESGGRLHEVRVPREQLDWEQMLTLTPGSYALTEASHPQWVCHIVITAQ